MTSYYYDAHYHYRSHARLPTIPEDTSLSYSYPKSNTIECRFEELQKQHDDLKGNDKQQAPQGMTRTKSNVETITKMMQQNATLAKMIAEAADSDSDDEDELFNEIFLSRKQ